MRRDRVRRPEPPSHGGGWPGDPRAVLHPDHYEEPEGRVLEVGLPDGHHVHVQPGQPARRKESSWIRSWHQIASSRDAGNTSGYFWRKISLHLDRDHDQDVDHNDLQARSCDNKSPLSERSSGDGGSDRETCGHYATVGRCCIILTFVLLRIF